MTIDPDAWERHAEWWQTGFTDGADPEYEDQIKPLALEWLRGYPTVIDIGAGEGQIARHLASHGASVVGVDPTPAQLATAAQRGGGPRYVRATAGALPISSGAFEAAVACLVFEHIADHAGAIAEVARVLAPGGRFVLFLNHPLLQCPGSGWIIDHILDEEYWRVGPYLLTDVVMEELSPGVSLPFVHRPLSEYVNLLAANDLLMTQMLEPAPPATFIERAEEYQGAASIPRLCVLITQKIS